MRPPVRAGPEPRSATSRPCRSPTTGASESDEGVEPLRCPREIPAGQSRPKAQVVVGFGDTTATGVTPRSSRQRGAYVHLVRGQLGSRTWANMGRLIAHEFGHVVGPDHARAGRVQTHGGGPGHRLSRARRRGCTTVDGWPGTTSVARSDSMGPGPPVETLLPAGAEAPQLQDVRFSGGDTVDSPLTVTWTAPGRGPGRIEGGDRGLRGEQSVRGTSDNRYGVLFSRSGPSDGPTILCRAGERDLLLRSGSSTAGGSVRRRSGSR